MKHAFKKSNSLVLLFISIHLMANEPDGAVKIKIWEETLNMLSNIRVSYEISQYPTPEIVERMRKIILVEKNNAIDKEERRIAEDLYSKRTTKMDISIKDHKYNYLIKTDVALIDFDRIDKSDPFSPFRPASDELSIYSPAGLLFLDNLRKRGAFRAHWPTRPVTPLSYVQIPPDMRFFKQDDDGKIEMRDQRGKSARKFRLDTGCGMLPTLIEYYDVLSDGDLFLFRFIKIEKYLKTEQGIYIPQTGTVYDFVSNENDPVTWKIEERFELTKSEVRDIPESEFEIKFPPGTQVTDYTINVDYVIPENGRNPIFSVSHSDSIEKPVKK